MTALVRAAQPEEAEAILEVLSLAFGLDRDAARPLFYADPYYDLLHKRVLCLPGAGVASCLTIVPTALRIGGVPVPAAGVAGVATRPAFQRRGYAGTLLAATKTGHLGPTVFRSTDLGRLIRLGQGRR